MIDQSKSQEELKRALGKGPNWYARWCKYFKVHPAVGLIGMAVFTVIFFLLDRALGTLLLVGTVFIAIIVLTKAIHNRLLK